MADPKQKSLERDSIYLTRFVPMWTTPGWMEAERWRRVVDNQPIAAICEDTLIRDLIGTPWEVRAKNPKEAESLAGDIEAYTEILSPDAPGGLSGFDIWVSQMATDMLRIPVGGNSEVIRWPDGMGPFSRPHPKGHVYKLAYIDGGTVAPTYDGDFVMVQRVKSSPLNAIYFRRNEIMRLVMRPKVEMLRWGYGMAPPEKIYLAISSLFRGDAYYANLLLDTPEAGILDLANMSKESAEQWVSSFRELMTGIDPFKVPVLYEHDKPASYISFGRPPTELMFSEVTTKYSSITHAGYGLSHTDTGLGDPQKTLAGSIRDERRSRRSGFGTVREKVKTAIDKEILPDYLEFHWVEKDEETRVQKGRSFVLFAQALKTIKEAGFINTLEGQQQLLKEGYFDIELEEPEEQPVPVPLALPAPTEQIQQETDRKPASEGGRGDITGKAELGDNRITAVPRDSNYYDQLAGVIRRGFAGIMNRMDRPRLMRLIKAALRRMYPDVTQSLVELADTDLPAWQEARVALWFGQNDNPEVQRAADDLLDSLDGLLDKDAWWMMPESELVEAMTPIFQMAYGEGATRAAEMVQQFLYTEGLRDAPEIIGLNFNLKNPRTLAELEKSAAQLVRRVNDGTRYYLKRIIVSGVDEGLSSPVIAEMIRTGAGVNDVLNNAGFTEAVTKRVGQEIAGMSEARANSIVNTEVAKAESMGRLGEWKAMGLSQKQWIHSGVDDACHICRGNQGLGLVPIDYLYPDVFGGALTPPGHPGVCHCHLAFSESELLEKADSLNVWMGD